MKRYFLYTIIALAFFSCEEILIEEDLSDGIVTITAPSDGTTVANTSVNFSWNAVDQATSYRLQIAYPSFESPVQVVEDTTVTKTNFSTTLVKNDYEWRVRAQNSGSETAYTMASFRVIEAADFAARELLLISPANNAFNNTSDITLQWESVADATLYRVQLLDASNAVIQEETLTATSLQLTFPEGVTKWQVRAENSTQNTLYFTRAITVDTMAPNVPVAVTPANEAVFTDPVINFTWTREIVEGTTEFDSIYIYSNPQLSELVTKDQVTSPSEITLDAGNTYYWFLKAFDQAGNQSAASNTLEFTIN